MTKFEKINLIIAIVLSILLVVSVHCTEYLYDKKNEQKTLISSLNAELISWKDKDSLNHSKIEIIETERAKDFLSLYSKDAEIKKLQETVRKYEKQLKERGSVTNITTSTEVSISGTAKIDTVADD